VWASEVGSPHALDVAASSDREAELSRECGTGEAGLHAVAVRLVERRLQGLPVLDAEQLAQALRVAGEPHVWPHAWLISGRALDQDPVRRDLRAWSATFREPGERRCGVAIGYGSDGTEAVAAVAVDAAADLAPLAVRTRVGAWLTIDARLLVAASGARVVVVGPSGVPRNVPSHQDGGHVRARLALDQPGAFTVQVLADLSGGPRPVAEASLFADVAPWSQPPDPAVPGEGARGPDENDGSQLLAMIQALRAAEHLPGLASDGRLDAAAVAHSARMMQQGSLAHDAGDGDPVRRIEALGLRPRETGENVAHAATLLLAHRALYASPSHRANLLARGFDRIGVGISRDADGSVWVTEELSGGTR
jgi:uncharacterized protein YkwD